MKYILCLLCWFCYLDCAFNQYVSLHRKPASSKSCENPNNTALVEHFFNIIFSEFHITPPVCVCVQMCTDQPTYCYPNGCLKREDNKSKQMNNMQSIPHGKDSERQSMLVVDEKNDFMTDFFKKIDVAEPKIDTTEKNKIYDMRPDPFKDKYKMLFKYKKLPKVQLRYNLREQVKNMKSDILKIETMDVSKTRWPLNKDKRVNKQRIYSEIKSHKTPTDSNTYFVSVYPDNNIPPSSSSSSKYFKRDLTNKTEGSVDILVLSQKDSAVNNTGFSLESLIDNLIENSFVKNYTQLNLKEIFNHNDNDDEQKVNMIGDNDIKDGISTSTLATTTDNQLSVNKSYNTVSEYITKADINILNVTNDIIDDIKDAAKNKNTIKIKNNEKYNDNKIERNTNTFNNYNEMIASLAKQIEKQNNTSMEIMKRIIGDSKDNPNVLVKLVGNHDSTTNDMLDTTVTEDTKSATQYNELKTFKRSKQRLRRKLENSKRN